MRRLFYLFASLLVVVVLALNLITPFVSKAAANHIFSLGGLSSQTGIELKMNTRVRTGVYDLTGYEISVNVGNTGTKYGIFFYDEEARYIGWTGWLTGYIYEVPENARYARVAMGYRNNAVIAETGLEMFYGCLEVRELEVEEPVFVLGGLNGTNGRELEMSTRVRTGAYDLTRYEIRVNVGNTGTKYGVFFYDAEEGYVGWTGWLTGYTYEVPENTRYARVAMGNRNNVAIAETSLEMFEGCLEVCEHEEEIGEPVFVLGGLNGINGRELEMNTRVRTGVYDLTEYEISVNVGDTGTKYGVFFYDEEVGYIGWTGWLTEYAYEVPENVRYARAAMGYRNNAAIAETSLEMFEECLEIREIEKEPVFVLGGLNGTNGRELEMNTRVRTGVYDLTEYEISVNVEDTGTKYGIFFYDDEEGYIGWTGWLTEYTYEVPENVRYARVAMGNRNNAVITESDLDNFNQYLEINEKPLSVTIDNITYRNIGNGTLCVVSYSGIAASLIIPETVNGMSVVEIGDEAFMGNSALTSISIPASISLIGDRAFKGCINLSTFKVGNNDYELGKDYYLADFADSGVTIGDQAFDGVDIQLDAPTDIVLNSVTYRDTGYGTLYVVAYSGSESELVIPTDVNGKEVVAIGDSAFEGNTSLTSISLPNTITDIDAGAFKNCANLATMTTHD